MTTIDEIRFSLVWCRFVPETLSPPFGELTAGGGFRDAWIGGIDDVEIDVPWEDSQYKWSRFWSSYLRQPKKIKLLSPDAAWDYLVPFAIADEGSTFAGPAPVADVDFDLWLFPHAVVIIGSVSAVGAWTVAEAAATAASLRQSKGYSRGGKGSRSLDGLATDLADFGASILASNAPSTGVSRPLSIAAGIAASGDEADLNITKSDVAATVAGLAVLSKNGTLKPDHLFAANTSDDRGGRVYWENNGHSIWNAEAMIQQTDRPGCIHQNHTDALALVVALSALISWAADEVTASHTVPVELHGLLGRAMCRLTQLKQGDANKTYRSEIVSKRIDPVSTAMDVVRNAGLPTGP